MTRKLLPYEYQMIEALGVTKEEYLDFLAAQQDYALSIEQKLQTPQAEIGTVALIFTIVGTLFQVAAALLAPKPQQPEQKNALNTRQQRFAPRFGFNNVQELARYGDPVNLIYCNADPSINPGGGVRVATALIWSAVSSQGSSQYMQTLMVIGASTLGEIDFTRSAFGQTPIRQFTAEKAWTYYSEDANANVSGGNVRFADLVFPSADRNDPTYTSLTDIVYKVDKGGSLAEGFSQSFSPSSLTTCGIFAPIPINILIKERDDEGQTNAAQLQIRITNDQSFLSNYWDALRPEIPVGTRLRVSFAKADANRSNNVAMAAEEDRFNYFSRIDSASTYKLGSAKFRLAEPLLSNDLDSETIVAVFKCVEKGMCPAVSYGATSYDQVFRDWRKEREELRDENRQIDAILLNPPPIYDPIVFDGLNGTGGELDTITTTIDEIEDLIEAFRGGGKIDTLTDAQRSEYLTTLATSALSDPVVKKIADEIILQDAKLDEATGPTARANIRDRIRRLQRSLARAIDLYGIREGVVVDPRTGNAVTGRVEIRKLQRLVNAENRKAFNRILEQIGATGGGRDLAAEAERDAELRAKKVTNNDRIAELNRLINTNISGANDYFSTKCLVKIEEAAYQTITDSKIIRFSLKARVFQRVAGRQTEYGEVEVDEYKLSDNGLKFRTAMFWIWYRSTSSSAYQRVPYVFGIRRRADADNFIDISFIAPTNGTKWEFKFEPIADLPAELAKQGNSASYPFAYIENNGPFRTITNNDGTIIRFRGKLKNARNYLPPIEKSPYGVSDWGLFSARGDTQISYSFENGPEISIMAVTEQREENLSTYPGLYDKLALIGFNAYSGQGVQDLRSFTVFVKKGRLVRPLLDNGTLGPNASVSSSYVPEIFLDTALNRTDGIGQYVREEAFDLNRLVIAKKFCQNYGLFFDGIISEGQSWREFWAEVAPFSLLELGRIGGKETLVPAVPTNNSGTMLYNTPIPVSALFNAGNILEDSYKEEFIDYGNDAQDLIANVIYRYTEQDETFPRNRSVEVRRAGVTDLTGIRQTFDLSDYVTSKQQAILFAKLLCQQRRYIRRNVEFKTFPTDAPLYPGAYIYIDIGNYSWQGIYSGKVETGGALNAPLSQNINGSFTALLYKLGQQAGPFSVSVTNNVATGLAGYEDWLFVLGTEARSKRVFKVVEVEVDEEGEVTVRAVEHPTDTAGNSLITSVARSIDDETIVESIFATSSTMFQVLE